MDGNDKKKVKKPCAKCKGLKQFCTHFTMEYPVSYKTACEKCRGKHDKCTHNARAGGAGAGQPKRTEVAPKPAAGTARMSYAEAVRAAQRAPAAAPERALTVQEREAAEAFMAPVGPVVEYEVLYFNQEDVPGHNPDLR